MEDATRQLISRWLDEPQNEALRAAVEAQVAADPAVAAERDAWRTLHRLLAQPPAVLDRVDWPRYRAMLEARLDADTTAETEADAQLTTLLAALPSLDSAVDWEAYRNQVSAAVGAHADQAPPVRRRRVLQFTSGLAAAAAILLALLVWPEPVVEKRVQSATTVGSNDSEARVIAEAALPAEEPISTIAIAPPEVETFVAVHEPADSVEREPTALLVVYGAEGPRDEPPTLY